MRGSCARRSSRSRRSSSTHDKLLGAVRPLQQQVKDRGLWAAHLPPELGGGGFGQVKLGLMHEILGQSVYAAGRLRQQRARLGQRRAHRRRRHRRAEGQVAAAPARRRAAQRLLDDRARRRRRPHAAQDHGPCATATSGSSTATSGSRRTGRSPTSSSSWPSPTPTCTLPGQLDDHRADRHARASTSCATSRPWSTRSSTSAGSAATPRSSTATSACPTRTSSATRATASCSPRSASAPAASTTACAGWARVQAGLRHAVRAGGQPLHPRLGAGREADHPELGRRLDGRDARRPGCSPCTRRGRWTRSAPRRPAPRSP